MNRNEQGKQKSGYEIGAEDDIRIRGFAGCSKLSLKEMCWLAKCYRFRDTANVRHTVYFSFLKKKKDK